MLWRDVAAENDANHYLEMEGMLDNLDRQLTEADRMVLAEQRHNEVLRGIVRRLQEQIKEARDGEEDAQGINEKAKVYLAKARTKAGRAEFAAASVQCTRAEQHAKDTHALISTALEVLDMAT